VECTCVCVKKPKKALDGDEGKRLTRVRGERQRLLGLLARELVVAIGMVVPRPEQRALSSAEDGIGPVEPAVVGFEPGAGVGKVVDVEGQFDGDALELQRRREKERACLGRRAIREDLANPAPCQFNIPLPIGEWHEPLRTVEMREPEWYRGDRRRDRTRLVPISMANEVPQHTIAGGHPSNGSTR